MKIDTKKFQLLLFEPNNFFQTVAKEKKIKPAVIFYLIFSIISAVISVVVFLLDSYLVTKIPLVANDYLRILATSVFGVVFSLVVSFVWAFLLHSWLKIFGAKGNYLRTYQIFVYSSIPSLLFNWVPVLGILALTYGLCLIFLGTTMLHKLSRKRTLVALGLILATFIYFSYLNIDRINL